MEIEFSTRVLAVDETLEKELQKMINDGWMLIPGVKAVAVYPCQRIKGLQPQPPESEMAGMVKVHIDESKIGILRNGKIID